MKLDQARMLRAFPAAPEAVKARMETTLTRLNRGETGETARRGARRLSFTAALAVALTVVVFAAAAGIHFGVFDFMGRLFGVSGVLPAADDLVQTDLATLALSHVTLHVQEAVYDGGDLRVVYSITQNDASAPLTEAEANDPQSAFRLACAADQALTECDWFTLNGMEYTMTSGSTCDTAVGEENGQLLCYLDICLSSAGILPQGDFTVGLPVAGGAGQYQTLTFTVNASTAAQARPALRLSDATVTVTSAFLSPVRSYVNLHIQMDADAAEGRFETVTAEWYNAELVDANGVELALPTDVDTLSLTEGSEVDYACTFLPTDAGEVYLAPVTTGAQNERTVDMANAIRLK